MIKNVLTVLVYMFVQVSFAQQHLSPSNNNVALIKKSPMLVIQKDSVQRQENQKIYEILSSVIKTYWKYSKFENNDTNFEANDTTQVYGMYIKKIMAYDWKEEKILVRSTFREYNPMKNRYEIPRDRYKTQLKQVQYGNTAILFVYDLLSKQNILNIYLPDTLITKTNYLYGIKLLQYQLNYLQENKDKDIDYLLTKEVENNITELKKLTLMIDKNETELKQKDIQKIYPYKYQLVNSEEIEKSFLQESSDKAIMKIINFAAPLGLKIQKICVVMNPNSGKIYMYDIEKTKDVRVFGKRKTRVPAIDKKQLIKMVEMIK